MLRKKRVNPEELEKDIKEKGSKKSKKKLATVVGILVLFVLIGYALSEMFYETGMQKGAQKTRNTSVASNKNMAYSSAMNKKITSRIKQKKHTAYISDKRARREIEIDKTLSSISNEEIDKLFMSFADEERLRRKLEEEKKRKSKEEKKKRMAVINIGKYGSSVRNVLPHDKPPVSVGEREGKFKSMKIKLPNGQQVPIEKAVQKLMNENKKLSQKLKRYEQEFRVVIYGIICDDTGCIAKTNLGYIRPGKVFPNKERVVGVTDKGIITNKRTIIW